MCGKPHELFFKAMKTAISDFMVLNYVMKFPWNSLPVIFMNHEKFTKPWIWIFMGHESLIYFHDPWKGSYSLACISWVMKFLIAHEIPMKAQLKTHESVQLTVAQK